MWINPLGPEALIIVDGVIQQKEPRLTSAEIADVQVVRGSESAVHGRPAQDLILITTTRAGTSPAP